MPESEAFTVVRSSSYPRIYDDYEEIHSGHAYDLNTSIQAALRHQYPELNLTVAPENSVPLLRFAAQGNATAELDITTESIQRVRNFFNGSARSGVPDQLAEARSFAKYHYKWASEDFILYTVFISSFVGVYNFILKEPGKGETTISHCASTDALIFAVGSSFAVHDENFIYVYDGYWAANRGLWAEVQKARWKDVILNEEMKKTVTELMQKFFESKEIYRDLGVPWKRGVIFHGPAGNGKTISIKALMHSLSDIKDSSIPALYVKSAPNTYDIRNVFTKARYMAPCMLILEDIDTIVTARSRSYFFNEVDGLENNDGIFMVASTNHLDRLDPGLSSRPSRFDRKYLFPMPSEEERVLYCDYWRGKLKNKPTIKFPKLLSPAIAALTDGFSFAYLKEAFVASLLIIAGRRAEESFRTGNDNDKDHLDDYELWREIKKQIKLLRDDMDSSSLRHSNPEFLSFPPELPAPTPRMAGPNLAGNHIPHNPPAHTPALIGTSRGMVPTLPLHTHPDADPWPRTAQHNTPMLEQAYGLKSGMQGMRSMPLILDSGLVIEAGK